jgi:GrpB-like predicted nucleotidyltransferase (UPF0157 family)
MPLVVVDYDPAWPQVYETLRARIQPVVADIAVAIEHIGSTAVPGLAAKPIIDLVVVVPVDRVATAIDRLAGLGYVHKGDLGVPGREAFAHPPDTPRHHLYVCPVGNTGLANPLAVRDYLRAHPEAALEYAELKRRLAVRFADDVDGYVEGKTAFILDVLRRSGFDETVLRDIERINRRPTPSSSDGPRVPPTIRT